MKLLSYFLFTISFVNLVFASDIPCNVIGTSKDPNLIKIIESGPGSSTPEQSLMSYKDQYADAVRCKNKADQDTFKMYIEGLEDAIARDKAKKNNSTLTSVPANISSTNAPAQTVVKKISIDCDDEATKPKTRFKIFGTDTNGAVAAEGYKDQIFVKLNFDNKKPENGRVIEVGVNGETKKQSLSPGLGPIGFNPGFAMKMLLKAIGVNTDIKITCMPLSQTVIPEPLIEAPASSVVEDGNRNKDAIKATEVVVPASTVSEQDKNTGVQK